MTVLESQIYAPLLGKWVTTATFASLDQARQLQRHRLTQNPPCSFQTRFLSVPAKGKPVVVEI